MHRQKDKARSRPRRRSVARHSDPFIPQTLGRSLEAPDRALHVISDRAHWAIFLGLACLALALRFFGLGSKGLWFDEVHTLTNTLYPLPWGRTHDLFFVLDRLFQVFSSDPTIKARIYPALAGSLSVPLLYLFVSRLHSRFAGLLAAVVLCLHPFHLLYSQEARYYAPAVLFALISLWGTVEFAASRRPWRFLWIPILLLSGYCAVRNHPTSTPFVLAHGLWFGVALVATRWGFDAVLQIAAPLRGKRWARNALIMVALLAGTIVVSLADRTRGDVIRALFRSPWGATPEVDFTWKFFAGHLAFFGWDLREVPVVGALSPWIALILLTLGGAHLLRRLPSFASLLFGLMGAMGLAIFAFYNENSYLSKYSAPLLPVVLALCAIGVAALAGWGIRISPRIAKVNPVALIVLISAIAALGQIPGALRYYRLGKMPLRPQFAWLNENEPDSAEIFVYGHGGYPASLYRDELVERHRLNYFPWVPGPEGRLEASVLRGSAASGRPTYFAYCWPHDIPSFLGDWLRETATVAARFPSLEGQLHDGILYSIVPGEPGPESGAARLAATIDGIQGVGRAEIVQAPSGQWSSLKFSRHATVRYNFHLAGGQRYIAEIEAIPASSGDYFVALNPEQGEPLVFGGDLAAGETVLWRGELTPARDSAYIELRHVSDYAEQGGAGRSLTILRVSVRSSAEGEAEGIDAVALPPLKRHAYPWDSGGEFLKGWINDPPGGFQAHLDRGEDFLRIKLQDVQGRFLAPVFAAREGDLIHVRARARLDEAFGWGTSVILLFLNEAGSPILQATLSETPIWCRVEWDPWIAPLRRDPWMEFQTVRAAPPGAAAATVGLLLWQSPGRRRYDAAANEVHLGPIELSILRAADRSLQGR